MALAHTILATLASASYSGYDLSKLFEGYVSCFWKASQQQIYRELGKMETRGWVKSETIPQVGRPDKKVYSITDCGKQELCRWLAEPVEPSPIREDLLVKISAGYLVPKAILLAELERHRQLHQEQLAFYLQKEQESYQNLSELPLEKQYRYLVLQRGIRFERDWIAWCDEAIQLLQTKIDSEKLKLAAEELEEKGIDQTQQK